MQYHGGKEKIAKDLSEVIRSHGAGCTHYLEPFIGGASIFARMAPHFPGRAIGADYDLDVAALWAAVSAGEWEPPAELTREQYDTLKMSGEPSPLRAFAAFGCSFGGKKWGGYAKNNRGDDFAGAARRGILKKQAGVIGASVARADYRAFAPGAGTLVYADPPYAGTTGYTTGAWDVDEFWATMAAWSEAGAVVLVSEYEAPEGWVPVWSRERRTSMSATDNLKVATEKLFIHKPTAARREQSAHLAAFYA
jgi:DNA adenine methylase